MRYLLLFAAFITTSASLAAEGNLQRRVEQLEAENRELRERLARIEAMLKGQEETPPEATPPAPQETAEPAEPRLPSRAKTFPPTSPPALPDETGKRWDIGLRPNGGGLFAESVDGDYAFNLSGYLQSQLTFSDPRNTNGFGDFDFLIRRARLSLGAQLTPRYDLHFQVDVADRGGAGLIDAYFNAKLYEDALQARIGKQMAPFSRQDMMSSRKLNTVERYSGFNALSSINVIDDQIGGSLWGEIPVAGFEEDPGKLTWWVGVFNGNSNAGANAFTRDDNAAKEIIGRLFYQPTPDWEFGASVDYNVLTNRTLSLVSFGDASYLNVPVANEYIGFELDAARDFGDLALRAEGIYYNFWDSDLELWSGYGEATYWLHGDESGGFQPVFRAEHSRMAGEALAGIDGRSMTALTFGFNWFIDGHVRLQFNYIGEIFDGSGNGGISGAGYYNVVLSQVQVQF